MIGANGFLAYTSGNPFAYELVANIPEPGTFVLLVAGLFGLAYMIWKRAEG